MKFLRNFLACLLAIIVAQFLFLFVLIGIGSAIASSATEKQVVLDDKSVLKIDFSKQILDNVDDMTNIMNIFDEDAAVLKLIDVLDAIDGAKKDSKIKGIVLDLNAININLATCQEIREALKKFKESGKFIVSYANDYTQKAYYMASVADSVYLNPQGDIYFKGIGGEMMFFSRTLKKIGVEPQVIRCGKYKSAIEQFVNTKMSPENRLQTERLYKSIWDNMIVDIAKSRKISDDTLNMYADNLTVQSAEDALKYKLVDGLLYDDQFEAKLKKLTKDSAELNFIDLTKYVVFSKQFNAKTESKNKIALIYAQGQINGGKSKQDNIGEDLIKTIRKAREDKDVKAVVFRINSPGGSALVSDIIWREIKITNDVKPVVASFGDYAASGGYYIAASTSKIIAEPNTITGSIGVFGLFFSAGELFKDKIGLDFDVIKTNKNSDQLNLGVMSRPMSKTEKEIVTKHIDKTYNRFVTLVSQGRKKTFEQIHEIAQGRVWTGSDAKEIGLVDEIGGLEKAISTAKFLANISSYSIKEYSNDENFFTKIKNTYMKAENALVSRVLGDEYQLYLKKKELTQNSGIQARMAYDITFE